MPRAKNATAKQSTRTEPENPVLALIPTAKESDAAMRGVADIYTGRRASQRERQEAMDLFDLWLKSLGFESEIAFAKPRRDWALDYGHRAALLAVEREGGTWQKSRHATGPGYYRDCTKYNAAILMGWTVLRFTVDHLLSGEAHAHVLAALHQRGFALDTPPAQVVYPLAAPTTPTRKRVRPHEPTTPKQPRQPKQTRPSPDSDQSLAASRAKSERTPTATIHARSPRRRAGIAH